MGDTALPGIAVTLRDADFNIRAAGLSDAAGMVLFAGLPPATYTVWITTPPTYTNTTPNPATISLASGDRYQLDVGLTTTNRDLYLPYLIRP